jgi:hypothetical protein
MIVLLPKVLASGCLYNAMILSRSFRKHTVLEILPSVICQGFGTTQGELIYTEPIDHLSELHPLVAASSDVAFSDTSPDDSSSECLRTSPSNFSVLGIFLR